MVDFANNLTISFEENKFQSGKVGTIFEERKKLAHAGGIEMKLKPNLA